MRGHIEMLRPGALRAADVEALYGILSDCRQEEGQSSLLDALAHCQRVLLFRETRGGPIVGSTLLRVVDLTHEGRAVRLLYTSFVVIAAGSRGQAFLQRAGALSALRFGWTPRRLYWMASFDSVRAYLVGARGFRTLWPRCDDATPPFESTLLERASEQLFGEDWDRERGLCVSRPMRPLRPEEAAVDQRALATDPHAAFFLARNPRYLEGYSLPALARVSALGLAGMLARGLRRPPAPRSRPVEAQARAAAQ